MINKPEGKIILKMGKGMDSMSSGPNESIMRWCVLILRFQSFTVQRKWDSQCGSLFKNSKQTIIKDKEFWHAFFLRGGRGSWYFIKTKRNRKKNFLPVIYNSLPTTLFFVNSGAKELPKGLPKYITKYKMHFDWYILLGGVPLCVLQRKLSGQGNVIEMAFFL